MPVEMIQHPVGQGGFFSGRVERDGRVFNWVYDCGSDQKNYLHRRIECLLKNIKNFNDDRTIHILFLSHLDSDHVNGLEYFLRRCRQEEVNINQVVIPYLGAEDTLFGVASDAVSGNLSESFLQLARNASGWFIDYGVKSVTEVSRGSEGPSPIIEEVGPDGGPSLEVFDVDDSEGTPPQLGSSRGPSASVPDEDDSDPDDNEIKPVWISNRNGNLTIGIGKSHGGMRSVPANSIIALSQRDLIIDFMFVPYSHEPSEEKMEKFKMKLNNKFPNTSFKDIIKNLGNQRNIDDLKSCYDEIWGDHNLVSMALYMGPTRSKNVFHVYGCRKLNEYRRKGGWLLTGDAKLSDARRPEQFEDHYKNYASNVSVLMAPHHGSNGSFKPSILNSFTNLDVFYAAVGPNGHGHPGHRVYNAASNRRIKFRSVGLNSNTYIKLITNYWPVGIMKNFDVA